LLTKNANEIQSNDLYYTMSQELKRNYFHAVSNPALADMIDRHEIK